MIRLKLLPVLLLCLLIFVGCRRFEGPSRTVLVYFAGDNTISSELTDCLNAILQGWERTDNNIIIYHDASDAAPKLLTITIGKKKDEYPVFSVIEEYNEENSASPEVFQRVLSKVTTDYSADSYGLIFGSHSSGWLPSGTLRNPDAKSLGIDEEPGVMTGREIDLADFAAVIPDGQFDYIVFECCLMAGVEVVYELRNKTNYIVASSAELLAEGFLKVYPTSIMKLVDYRTSVKESLISFSDSYFQYMDAQKSRARSATISVINTEDVDLLVNATATLLNNPLASDTITDVWALQHFDRPGKYGDNPASPRYFDFGEYMHIVGTVDDYSLLDSVLNKVVIWKNATPYFLEGPNGFEIKHHSGMTIYIEQDCFPKLNDSYKNTGWYKAINKK